MKECLVLLILLLLGSCTFKQEVIENYSDINELNKILLKNQSQLKWENYPDTVALKIKETELLIKKLKKRLNLTKIESHKTVRWGDNIQKAGLAYYFGERNDQTIDYNILVFGQDSTTLELFKTYEQFSDCSKQEPINLNWIFVSVDPDCNN